MTPETDLRARLAELCRRRDTVLAGIPSLLAAGAATAAARADAAELERQIADTEGLLSDAVAEREAETLAAISRAAEVIAINAENTITATLAALLPPEHL